MSGERVMMRVPKPAATIARAKRPVARAKTAAPRSARSVPRAVQRAHARHVQRCGAAGACAECARSNQEVQRALNRTPLQRSMAVTQPGDASEAEAERVADAVLRSRGAEPVEPIVTAPGGPVAPASAGAAVPEVTPAVESGIQASRSSGHPLPQSSRDFLEPRLGHDLGAVRLHSDSTAAGLARRLDARAFTSGNDVYFAEGEYQPHTAEGTRLLAHELTHTVQQQGDAVAARAIQRMPGACAPTSSALPPPGTHLPAPGPTDNVNLGSSSLPNQVPAKPTYIQGDFNQGAEELTLPEICIPGYKLQADNGTALWNAGLLRKPKGFVRPPDIQIQTWRNQVGNNGSGGVSTAIDGKLRQALNPTPTGAPAPSATVPLLESQNYDLKQRITNAAFSGRPSKLARDLSIPTWDRAGAAVPPANAYQVDHIRELQLANYPGGPPGTTADQPSNLWLVDGPINMASGRSIQGAISQRITAFRESILIFYREREYAKTPRPSAWASQAEAEMNNALPDVLKSTPDANEGLNITFSSKDMTGAAQTVSDSEHWKRTEIEQGLHIAPATGQPFLVPDMGLSPGQIRVYTSGGNAQPGTSTGPGAPVELNSGSVIFAAGSGSPAGPETKVLAPMRVAQKNLTAAAAPGAGYGTLTMTFAPNQKWFFPPGTDTTITVADTPQPQTGAIAVAQAQAVLARASYKGLSPIRIQSAGVEAGTGFTLRGQIVADVPLLRDGIDFQIAGDSLSVYKEFSMGAIGALPAPLHITDAGLILSASTDTGLSVAGRLGFRIDRVGSGHIGASAGTSEGFALEGEFNFDTAMFDPARIVMRYRDGQWSGEGEIGIPDGKVRGIRRASVRVSYAEGRLAATGTADLNVPGVQSAGLSLTYSEAEGLTIGGDVTLANNIPGIRSGSGRAQVRQRPDQPGYEVSISGRAQPAIPGVDAELSFAYENGALTVEGTAAYARGMLSGSLRVGATNRPVDPDGNPVPGGQPTERLTAYGGGTVTIRVAPWLQGTVGLRLLPNGEIEVSGSIGLPSAVDIFPAKEYTRNIFRIGIDIPIVGVAVAGQRIGIFATIQGGLDLDAGVGPGQIQELSLGITYNPAHEDQTHVTGHGALHIPAHAGLRLFVRGGLGAGIPIVSATAALEIGGRLGLEGAVHAGVDLDWTPTTGLAVDALGEIYVEPKFRFDITGMVLVEANLLLTTIELYSKRWQLAAFEWGSGMRLGIKFPVHYREGQPFDVNWNDVEFVVPDIDPQQVLSGLIGQLA